MENSASDMDIDDDTVLDVGDIVVLQNTNNEQEPEVIIPEEIEKNDQSFASASSNDFNLMFWLCHRAQVVLKRKKLFPYKN